MLQDNFTEEKFRQKELKEEQIKETKEIEQTILPTIFSTELNKLEKEFPTKKPRNKWKNKKWSKFVFEFLSQHQLYKTLSINPQKKLITDFLKNKLGLTEIKP